MFTPEEIAEVARRVAAQVVRGRGTPTQQDDFVAEALALLVLPRPQSPPRITLYDPAEGELEGWLATTLRNAWLSKLRAERSRTVPLTGSEAGRTTTPFPWASVESLLGMPFSNADQERIDNWPAGERLDLLALSGLSVKLPPDRWESYIREGEAVYRVSLLRPFPPPGAANESPGDRQKRIAAALGIPTNTLAARWLRKKQRLAELDCIQDLKATFNDRGTHP